MKRLLIVLLLLSACGVPEVETVTVEHHNLRTDTATTTTHAGPQLVTEAYLREELALKMAPIWTFPLCQILVGPGKCRVVGHSAPHWTNDNTVTVEWVYNVRSGVQFHYTVDWKFDGPDYQKDDGTVSVGNCQNLPGAGTATTGEYSTLDNQTGSTLRHEIDKTVTEADDQSTTLDESVELSTGVTVEAGSEATPKVSTHFDSTFGFSRSQTHDHSTETSVTVQDEITVPAYKTYTIAFTTNNGAIDCDVDLNAVGDWTSIDATIHKCPKEEGCDSVWRLSSVTDSRAGPNAHTFWFSDLITDNHHETANMSFDESDSIYRAYKGFDNRCHNCQFYFDRYAARSLADMADPETRHVSFKGTRHQTTKKDASYKVIDTTAADQECMADALSQSGTLLDHLPNCGQN